MKQTLTLIPGLPTKKLVAAIHQHLRGGDAARRALAYYLRDMERRGEHQSLGYSSTVQFAEGALGLKRREARDVLRIARALEELPEINRAFGAGQIGWQKLREITRVATPQTEKEWLEFARRTRAASLAW